MKVLIVDDSILLQQRLADMLSQIDGIEIVGSATGESEALSMAKEYVPDVVILDVRLREGNGISVLQKIKNHSSNVIVIILTSYPYPQYRDRCITAGADFFFCKSTEFDSIPEVLQWLVMRSSSKKANLKKQSE